MVANRTASRQGRHVRSSTPAPPCQRAQHPGRERLYDGFYGGFAGYYDEFDLKTWSDNHSLWQNDLGLGTSSGRGSITCTKHTLSRRLASEQQDPKWAAEVEQQMQALLHHGGISSGALELVDCRETICRLKLLILPR